MENTNFNRYLFKALEAYPYNLEEAIEALSYALSYDAKNVQALCLMGKIYTEQLGEYEAAKECYAEAMASNMDMPTIYPDYIRTLLWNEDYKEAKKLIDFALTVKATDKGTLHILRGQLFEGMRMYKKAIKAFETSKKFGYNNDFIRFAENEINRIKKKLPKKKRKKA
ncbi:MAG: hypothetical protein AAF554_06085 [Bacteroidota bacterium]